MSDVHVYRFGNGLTLLIDELNRPTSATHLSFPGGAAADPAGSEGASAVLHALAQRGAGSRDTRALSEAFDGLGFNRGGGALQATDLFTLSGLAADWVPAMELLADILLRPALPPAELEPCRTLALQELASIEDNPGYKARIELTRRYFPTAYGRCTLGSPAGVRALTADGLRQWWETSWRPDGAVLSVAGGVPATEVAATVERLFGAWSGAGPALPAPSTTGRIAYEHLTHETEQVQIALAYDDVPPTDPTRYQSSMAVQVLSGGMGARLFTEVREKRGLCYSVGAGGQAVPGHGFVVCSAGTTTARSSETLEVLVGELRRLPGTVEPDEVARGRVRLLSSMVMSEESTSSRAGRIANDWQLLGRVRTPQEMRAGIEAVTVDSLNAWLAEHPPRDFTIVTLGPSFEWPAGLTA